MRKWTWMIGTASFSLLWLVASCGENGDDDGNQLQVATGTGPASSSANTGGGGGEGGAASSSGSGGDSGTGGMGGMGGQPEQPINGCLSTTAIDMTAIDPVNIDIPGGNYCVRVAQGSGLTFTLATPPDHRYLGGVYDDATQQKLPDANSPILSSCDASPYTCSPAVTNPPYTMASAGVYPWYDDKNPGTIRGVVYVE